MWNPTQYARFSGHRNRPFFDLLSQVEHPDPHLVVDLGCGTGELTLALADRWPVANVVGVDSSTAMLDRATELDKPGNLTFQLADIATWTPPEAPDLLVSNAALQWLPDHESLIPRLAAEVAQKGTFAFQVPGNFTAPSHTILMKLRHSDRWKARLGSAADRSAAVKSTEWYATMLLDLGFEVNAWETTYLQILTGDDPVLEWVKGTALRPVLDALDGGEQEEFLEEYRDRLREAYPAGEHGTLFPFRRIFVVARRGE